MNIVTAGTLRLEPQTAAHAAEMFVVLSDPAIYEYESEPPQSLEGLRERFAELESRRSPNGREQWLNWVIRLPDGRLAGYVQATVHPDRHASIAYELNSSHWGRGLARQAVEAMLGELATHHGVPRATAVLKQVNQRSLRLLQRLGFTPASGELLVQADIEKDEFLMVRELAPAALSSHHPA
jgi:RimJ/RimL family protein N-acetyltransferase